MLSQKKTFNVNGWTLPINQSLQNILTKEEKESEFTVIATDLNIEYFLNNPLPEKPDLGEPQ